jgi:hypothetical protein
MLIALVAATDVLTVRLAVVARTNEPLVPVIVSVEVPRGVLDDVLTVRIELPEPETVDGLNEAVAPVGKPLTVNITVPVNCPFGVTMAAKLALLPGKIVCEVGDEDNEKSGDTVIVRVGGCGSVAPKESVTVREAV